MRVKNKQVTTCLQQALSLFVASFILLFVVYGAWHFYVAFSQLKPELAAAIIAGVFTVLGSVVTLALTHSHERAKEIEQEHRKLVVPVYSDFAQFWLETMVAERIGKEPKSEAEITAYVVGFAAKITMWSSDDLIQA